MSIFQLQPALVVVWESVSLPDVGGSYLRHEFLEFLEFLDMREIARLVHEVGTKIWFRRIVRGDTHVCGPGYIVVAIPGMSSLERRHLGAPWPGWRSRSGVHHRLYVERRKPGQLDAAERLQEGRQADPVSLDGSSVSHWTRRLFVVPRLAEFYGIIIYMYWKDHAPPPFHAFYAGDETHVGIGGGTAIEGSLPRTPAHGTK